MAFIGSATAGSALSAGIIGASSLASGALGYFGSQNAANTQAKAAQNALDFQKQTYADNQPRFATATSALQGASANFQPWINSGQSANYTLSQLLGGGGTNNKPDYSSFFNSPDFQFAQSQGQRGAINAANAQGVGLSGGTLKDLSEFNSGLATQQYGNYFNRLMGLSQQGQSAAGGQANVAGSLGNLATGAANANNTGAAGIGNTIQGIGQAQASGIVGGTNAITGGINSGVSNSLLYNFLQKQNPSAYGTGGSTSTGGALTGYDANGKMFGG